MTEEKIENLKTLAEKMEYIHKELDKELGKAREPIINLFDRLYQETQDETIKLNMLLGEINFWIFITHKNTGHDYKCILEQVIIAIEPIEKSMANPKQHKKDFKNIKGKIDRL